MPSEWSVLHHGKLLGPTGAIVPGAGYTVTGISAGFPADLVPACSPSVVGATDQMAWEKFQWRGEQATLVLRPLFTAGRWHLQAVRLRVRGEGAEGKTGRFFHQTAYLLLPLERLDDTLDLFGLPAATQNILPNEKRNDLAPARVTGSDEPLPAGWFDELTQKMVAAIVSGHGVALCDFSLLPDRFFAIGLRCRACLPAAVRWRIPIGAGFFETPAGFGFAHGQGIRGKVKVIEGKLKQADDAPLEEGLKYVDWIRSAAESARTVRELIEAVDAQFAHLSDPALSRRDSLESLRPDQPWTDAVACVVEAMRLQRLTGVLGEASAKQQAPPAPSAMGRQFLDGFCHLLRPVLQLLLRCVGRQCRAARECGSSHPEPDDPVEDSSSVLASDLLRETLTAKWRSAWIEVAGGHGPEARLAATIGMLGGILPLDPVRIDASLAAAMPREWIPIAVNHLSRELRQTGPMHPGWLPLIEAAGLSGAAPVFHAWRHADEAQLVWLGVVLDRSGQAACLSRWNARDIGPCGRAARAVLCCQSPDFGNWRVLCQSMPPAAATTAVGWAKQLFVEERVAEAYVLALSIERLERERGGNQLHRPWTPESLAAISVAERQRSALLLADTVCEGEFSFSQLRLPLMLWWDYLPETDRQRMGADLERTVRSSGLSSVFAHLAFGQPLPPEGSWDLKPGEASFLRALLAGDPARQVRLLELLQTPFARSASWEALLLGLLDAPTAPPGESQALAVLRAIRHRQNLDRLPALTIAEAGLLVGALVRLAHRPTLRTVPAEVVKTLAELRTFAALLGERLDTGWTDCLRRFLPELLTEAATDRLASAFWAERFREGRLNNDPVFRLVIPQTRPLRRPTDAEEDILLRLLADVAFLHYLWSFEELSPPLYGRVLLVVTLSDAIEPRHFSALADAARAGKDRQLYDTLLRGAFRRRVQPRGQEWDALVRELISDGKKWLDRSAEWGAIAANQYGSELPAPPASLKLTRRPSADEEQRG